MKSLIFFLYDRFLTLTQLCHKCQKALEEEEKEEWFVEVSAVSLAVTSRLALAAAERKKRQRQKSNRDLTEFVGFRPQHFSYFNLEKGWIRRSSNNVKVGLTLVLFSLQSILIEDNFFGRQKYISNMSFFVLAYSS
jgi:hypothetical protein